MQKMLALLGAKSKEEFVALLAQFIKFGMDPVPLLFFISNQKSKACIDNLPQCSSHFFLSARLCFFLLIHLISAFYWFTASIMIFAI